MGWLHSNLSIICLGWFLGRGGSVWLPHRRFLGPVRDLFKFDFQDYLPKLRENLSPKGGSRLKGQVVVSGGV